MSCVDCWLACAVTLALGLANCATSSPAQCTLAIVGNFPVTFVDRAPIITIKLNGMPLRMMVDTGASSTFLTPASYDKFDLAGTIPVTGSYGEGLGGDMQVDEEVQENLQIGIVTLRYEPMAIANFGVPRINGVAAADGLLGYDALDHFDIALDMPHKMISLYSPQHCATTSEAWAGDYDVVPLARRPDRLEEPRIPVQLDNANFIANIDTGAERTLFLSSATTDAGVAPLAVSSARRGGGLGNRPFTYRREQYASLTVGAETFADSWVDVGGQNINDAGLGALIGEDYLAHHRVFIATDTRIAYLGLDQP